MPWLICSNSVDLNPDSVNTQAMVNNKHKRLLILALRLVSAPLRCAVAVRKIVTWVKPSPGIVVF